MVFDAVIGVDSILAFLGGISGKLVYDEVWRYRTERIQNRQDKIDWYEELISLAKEIQFSANARRYSFNYFQSVSLAENSLSDVLSEEEFNTLLSNLESRGISNPEEVAEEIALGEWADTVSKVQGEIQDEMKMYEHKLRQHLSTFPAKDSELNDDIQEKAAKLLRYTSVLGTIGRINEEIENKIQHVVERLVINCAQKVSELE